MADKTASPFAGLDKALLRSTKQSSPPPPQKDVEQETAKAPTPDTTIPRHHDTAVSSMPPRNQDTTVAHAEDDILDVVRKAVRQIGELHRFLWTRHCRIRNREEQRDGQRNRMDGCGCWGCGQRGRATLVHAVHGPGRGGGRSIGARSTVEPFAQARRGAAADAGRAGRRLVAAARPAGL